jgi:uncharacterized membrane protein YfcA
LVTEFVFPIGFETWAIAGLVVTFAYVIFGITAFGAAMFTVPLLSLLLPLEFVLPVCVLLDVSASFALGSRFSHDAAWGELKWMIPFSVLGAVAGVTLLVNLPGTSTLAAFGIFLSSYAAYALIKRGSTKALSERWAPVSGLTGGITGTLFGVGGPPYVIYLSHRIFDKAAYRATLSNMVLASTGIRAVVFTVTGLMLMDRVVTFLMLLPFALLGLNIGHRLHTRLSREMVQRVASVLIFAIGFVLIRRAWMQGGFT